MDCNPPGSSWPWDFPSKKTGMGFHFLLQGTFPTQRSDLHLLHWEVDSLPLRHQGSPDFFCFKVTGHDFERQYFSGGSVTFVVQKPGFIFIHSATSFTSILSNSNIYRCPSLKFPISTPSPEAWRITEGWLFCHSWYTKQPQLWRQCLSITKDQAPDPSKWGIQILFTCSPNFTTARLGCPLHF